MGSGSGPATVYISKVVLVAAIARSMVLRWTGDHRIPGSNTPGAPFETLDFVRVLLFPLLKNSKSAEVSLLRSTLFQRLFFPQVYSKCYTSDVDHYLKNDFSSFAPFNLKKKNNQTEQRLSALCKRRRFLKYHFIKENGIS